LREKVTVFLGLGSNLGDRSKNISEAVRLLMKNNKVVKVSSFYETRPVGYTEQPDFINAVCQIITTSTPEELLIMVKKIENDMGRIPGKTNGPRIIDIDILLYEDKTMNTATFTIPHPRMTERFFVLIPLAEIAPEMIHPVYHQTIQKMLDDLGVPEGVKRLPGNNLREKGLT